MSSDSNTPIRRIYNAFQQSGDPTQQIAVHPGEFLIETPSNSPEKASAPNPFQTPDQVVPPPSDPNRPPNTLAPRPSTPPRPNPTRTRRTSRLINAHLRYFREPSEYQSDPDHIRSTLEHEVSFESVQPFVDLEDIQRLLDLLCQSPSYRYIATTLSTTPSGCLRVRFLTFQRPVNYFHTIWVVNKTNQPLPTLTTRLDDYVGFIHVIKLHQDFRATIFPLLIQPVNHLVEDHNGNEEAASVTESPIQLDYHNEPRSDHV